jgi:rhodanese-related sulfurtransferase
MTPFPLPITQLLGPAGANILYLVIGIAFGTALEMSGFATSTRLAAQFYLRDQTVIKVMFTAIVVAMILIFAASAVGLLDYNQVWVNPTYLWPGIVGGLIMGVGFIVGGFCPGTSLVAAATFKIDGVFFAVGSLFGMFLFGETVGAFDDFWHSSYMGRFTIPDLLHLDTGLVVVLIAVMAIVVFWGVEKLEQIFGKKDPKQAPKWRLGAAGVAVLASAGVMILGQPTLADRWARIAPEKEVLLGERAVQIHPGELLGLMHKDQINLVLLDVRDESDYNAFHILDAENVPLAALPNLIPALQLDPSATAFVVMSNDESGATEAWRILEAASVRNVYILEGGLNGWLDTFAPADFRAEHQRSGVVDDHLRYAFDGALGPRFEAANPDPRDFELTFEEKVVIQGAGAARAGGCG